MHNKIFKRRNKFGLDNVLGFFLYNLCISFVATNVPDRNNLGEVAFIATHILRGQQSTLKGRRHRAAQFIALGNVVLPTIQVMADEEGEKVSSGARLSMISFCQLGLTSQMFHSFPNWCPQPGNRCTKHALLGSHLA